MNANTNTTTTATTNTTNNCACGCNQPTITAKATFRPGHDAKLVSEVVKIAKDEKNPAEFAREMLKDFPKLAAKAAEYAETQAQKKRTTRAHAEETIQERMIRVRAELKAIEEEMATATGN